MSLTEMQKYKLWKAVKKLLVYAALLYVGWSAYDWYQKAKVQTAENQQRNEAYKRDHVMTVEEEQKIASLPEERRKDRAFVKRDGKVFSYPKEYYYAESMIMHWSKGNNYYGARGKGVPKNDDEDIRIWLNTRVSQIREAFESEQKAGLLEKRQSNRKDLDVYFRTKVRSGEADYFYVMSGFKDIRGNSPVARCRLEPREGTCVIGIEFKPNLFASTGELTAQHIDDLPEIYQAIMSILNQVEEIK
jgi:hypothetical protein